MANCATTTNPRFGVWTYLLPFIEKRNEYNAINFSGSSAAALLSAVNSVRNTTAFFTGVDTYICPSDLRATALSGNPVPYTQGSYAAMAGSVELFSFLYAQTSGINADICYVLSADGLFGLNRARRLVEITDGTSSTIIIGDYSRFSQDGTLPFNWWTMCGSYYDNVGPKSRRPQCIAYSAARLNAPPSNLDIGPILLSTGPFNWWQDPTVQNYGQMGFHSQHPGGVNFLFADGSVKFLKDAIDMGVYRSLSTINGGEALSNDAY